MDVEKHLLADSDGLVSQDSNNGPLSQFRHVRQRKSTLCSTVALVISLFVNLYFLIAGQTQGGPGLQPSFFARVPFDSPTLYSDHTSYWGSNESLADELWDNIDTSPVQVALTDDYANAHGIPLSVLRFPWDENKGVYFIKAFHTLHCLKNIRLALVQYERGISQSVVSSHVHHCLDALRKDTICIADDTPMPMVHLPNTLGEGQVRMCRDIQRLVDWTQEPDQSACYRNFGDFLPLKNKIEQYGFCPESSPSFGTSQAYFRKWGHKDPLQVMTADEIAEYERLGLQVESRVRQGLAISSTE